MSCVNKGLPLFRSLALWAGTKVAEDGVIAYTKFRTGKDSINYVYPTITEYSKYMQVKANNQAKQVAELINNGTTLQEVLDNLVGIIHKYEPVFNKTGKYTITRGIEFDKEEKKAYNTRKLQVNVDTMKNLESAFPEVFTVTKDFANNYSVEIDLPVTTVGNSINQLGENQFEVAGEIYPTYEDALNSFKEDYNNLDWLNKDQQITLLQTINKGSIDSTCK
jgi:hypothetical protein